MPISLTCVVGDVSEVPKTPLIVECRDCKHQWSAVWLPMSMAKVAKVLKNCKCPMCGGAKVYCAPTPSDALPSGKRDPAKSIGEDVQSS